MRTPGSTGRLSPPAASAAATRTQGLSRLDDMLRLSETWVDENCHGDTDRFGALLRSSLTAFRDLTEPGGTAESLVGLAALHALHGHATRAATLAGAAERLLPLGAAINLALDAEAQPPNQSAARR